MRISGRAATFCSVNKKMRDRSYSSSGEEEPLIRNQNKIISYGAQQNCLSGVSCFIGF